MSPKNPFLSKRAKKLVALCDDHPSPTSSELSPVSSCFTMSPVPSWWDGIFEASDIAVHNHTTSWRCVNLAKRKLSFSPVKGICNVIQGGSIDEAARKATTSLGSGTQAEGHIPTPKLCPPATLCEPMPCPIPKNIECCTNQMHTDNQVSSESPNDIESGSKSNLTDNTPCLVKDKDLGKTQKNEEYRFQLYPSQLRIMAAKLALNSGKEHFTTGGKLRRARTLKPPCKESCKRCATPKLNLSERQEINSEFWGLKDHVKQWKFIYSLVKCIFPKKKTSQPGAMGEKFSSRTYHLTACGKTRRVCKTMFKSTLSICDSWIDSAIFHFSHGEMTGDRRGRKSLQSV